MRKHTIIHYANEQGPKLFYADDKRIQIHEVIFDKEQFYQFMELVDWDFRAVGVYIIIGSEENETSNRNMAYIGETDSLRDRIIHHMKDNNKNWGEKAFLISSMNNQNPFSKTEIHYLEKELIKKIEVSGFEIMNNNDGQGALPTATERLFLNEELKFIKTGLEALGVQLNEEIISSSRKKELNMNQSDSVEIYAFKPNSNEKIFGIFNSDKTVTILADQSFEGKSRNDAESSLIKWVISRDSNYDGLEISGNEENYKVEFKSNITYRKPSSAGYLLAGGHNNGWWTWRIKSNDQPLDILRKK